MNRTTWLQDRRMKKFRDVLSRWERKELSGLEASELLGISERQFRRYRDRYEEEGLAGLADKRLGKASLRRVPVDEIAWMLDQYRSQYWGWNVEHFHEHLQRHHGFSWGYTWVKTQLHAAGLVERAKRRGAHRRKRPRKPCEGMMLHQDGSRAAWLVSKPPTGSSARSICPTIMPASPGRPRSPRAPLSPLIRHALPRSCALRRNGSWRATTPSPMRVSGSNCRKAGPALTTSRR